MARERGEGPESFVRSHKNKTRSTYHRYQPILRLARLSILATSLTMPEKSTNRTLQGDKKSTLQPQRPLTLQLTHTDKSSTDGESSAENKTVTVKHNPATVKLLRTIQGAVRPAGQACTPSAFQKPQQHKSRTHTVKGASFNLQKETVLLRQRLDRVVAGYHQSAVEHDRAQCHRLKMLSTENSHLQKRLRNLEVENLKLSNDLLDHEEVAEELKVERHELIKELRFYRSVLTEKQKEKSTLQSQLEAQNTELVERNNELTKKVATLIDRDTERQEKINELEVTLGRLRSIMSNKENDSFTSTATPTWQPKQTSSQKKNRRLPNNQSNNESKSNEPNRTAKNEDERSSHHCMSLRSHQAKKS